MTLDEATARRLGFPATAPQPVPGCRECARLEKKRAQAAKVRDHSTVSDCIIRLRTHEHQ